MSSSRPVILSRILTVTGLLAAAAVLYAQSLTHSQDGNVESRLRELEAKEQIRELMHNYGRFLDERDFTAFAALFTEADSEYVSGNQIAHGARAIGAMLKEIMAANPSGFKSPNFHVFFNEVITVAGDQAKAYSQSAYIVPGVNGSPEMVFFATYADVFTQEQGRWKFKQRVVHGNLPAREH